MALTQKDRHVELKTPLGEDVLVLRECSVSETLGRSFEIHIDAVSSRHDLDFNELVGEHVTIRLWVKDQAERFFSGVVRSMSQVGWVAVADEGGRERRMSVYHIEVVSWLWLLTRTSDCRIYQNMTVPDIIKSVFREAGLTDFEDALAGTYREWEYCVQYRETDFNFVSRLMEQEGIYYFFEHADGKHTLVLCDGLGSHEVFPNYEEIRFKPPDSAFTGTEFIETWIIEQAVQPGAYALNDFDFVKPRKDLQVLASDIKEHAEAAGEIYDYPGEYAESADGDHYAKVRLEELHAQHRVARGGGDTRGVAVGFHFKFVEHPREDQNIEYLVTSATHSIESDALMTSHDQTTEFRTEFTVLDLQTPFRTTRDTPKPLISGPQTAIVVGKSGEEIWTDEYGRVKVKFHWDRYSTADEKSSCWIRVSQKWAGKKWGSIHIPRIGQEVIIEFLEGDPDRPIITGRVYNGSSKPPYDLPANATMSTTKSLSSKGGGGFNEIRFEDKKDKEQLFIHAERRHDLRVGASSYQTIGDERHEIVEKEYYRHIKGDEHVVVDGSLLESIKTDVKLVVGGKQFEFAPQRCIEAGKVVILGNMLLHLESAVQITLKVGGSFITISSAGIDIVGPMVNINSGGSADSYPVIHVQADAEPAKAATNADPGELDEVAPGDGPPPGGGGGDDESDEEMTWISFELRTEDGEPVPREAYRCQIPDGSIRTGSLDGEGKTRISWSGPGGNCKICFPRIDGDEWRPL